MIYGVLRDIYMVRASVGVSNKKMHGHDVVVKTCSEYNVIASKSMPPE